MTSQWTYTLTHYDENNSWASTDITDDVISIPIVTDTGSGEVNSARVILSANEGKFIKSAPVIDQFDRIRIQIDDGDSTTTNYDRYFEVNKILPSESKSEGTRLELFLMGLEHNLQIINYIKPHYSAGTYEVMKDIGAQYNDSIGLKQPTLLGHDNTTYNKMPNANFQKNNYEFGANEAPCYDRMKEVVDSLGASVDNGGALDFYDFKFVIPNTTTYPTNTYDPKTHIMLKAFSSGSPTSGSEVIISDSTSVNVGETDSGIDNKTGTVVLAWGDTTSGSLPISFSQFASEEIRYPLYATWSEDEAYQIGAKVQYQGMLYKRIDTNVPSGGSSTTPNNDSDWQSRTKDEDYGTPYQYSQWTDNLYLSWKDNALDPRNTTSGVPMGTGFNDANIVVWDTETNWFRTWVDVRVTATNPEPSDISGDTNQAKYLYGGDTFYRGFRALLSHNSAPAGKWTGTDSNGNEFKQAIVECVTPGTASTAEWVVKYAIRNSSDAVINNKLVCIIRDIGSSEYNNNGAWTALGSVNDADYWHPFTEITESAGQYGADFSSNINTAIKVSTEWVAEPISGNINDSQQKHMAGGWLNFNFPFPHLEQNGNIDVGFWYGGAKSGRDAVCEPATLDIENMHISPQGYRGFNNGDTLNTECFGQINSINFLFKLDYQGRFTGSGAYTSSTEPNIPISVILVDTSDNMVKADFTVPYNNQWLPYKIPISDFQTYRALKPKKTIVDTIIPPKEISINNQIEWRNIKQIIFQTAGSYDGQGRYCDSALTGNFFANQLIKIGCTDQPFSWRKLDMYIDAFHFGKPLLVSSGQDTDKDIEADFLEKPDVFDYFQLKGMVDAEKQKRNFRHVEYEINTTGKFDIEMGDYFKFKHPRLIPDAPIASGTISNVNFIKLVAKRIEYSITKPVDGKGGFLRKILGVRRFV